MSFVLAGQLLEKSSTSFSLNQKEAQRREKG
jgi:hypothetical protein